MNQPDPLSQLRDIHLPEPVGWWPPAPGWWLLAFVVSVVVVALVFFLRGRFVNNRYRTVALNTLSGLDGHDNDSASEVLTEISAILRRVAIQTYGRQRVAPLAGDAWLAFLDDTGKTSEFSSGAARVLGSELYRPTVEADIEQVLVIAKKWIKEHQQC